MKLEHVENSYQKVTWRLQFKDITVAYMQKVLVNLKTNFATFTNEDDWYQKINKQNLSLNFDQLSVDNEHHKVQKFR